VSDPWDPEQRRPPAEADTDWPERDLWRSWDRPGEAEPAADTELPWADTEGDELWSDSVGSRPVSSVPWTGPTWDDRPWPEPPPGEPRPDLSSFIGPSELAEPASVEPRPDLSPSIEPVETAERASVEPWPDLSAYISPAEVVEPPPEAERAEPAAEPAAEAERAEPAAEPPAEPEPAQREPQAEVAEPEPPVEVERADYAAEPPAEVERAEYPAEPPAEVERAEYRAESPAEVERAEYPAEPPAEVERAEYPAEPAAEVEPAEYAAEEERTEPQPEPEPQPAPQRERGGILGLLERAGLVEPETREPEPTSPPLEPVGRFEPSEEPADETANEPAWTAPGSTDEPAWTASELVAEPETSEVEPVAEEWSEAEPVSEEAWTIPEPPAEAAWSVPEPAWTAPESVQGPPEPTEQAFAAFAPEPGPQAAEAELEREPEPEEGRQPYEPFEVIEGGALTGSLGATAGEIETTLGAERDWDGRSERRQPTTAEAVVPWLIGVILLLAGMVIVLLALIFTSDHGLLAGLSASPGASSRVAIVPSADPAATPSSPAASSASTPKPSTTPKPAAPTYGPLEMVYLGRSAALAHIYLLQHDFTAPEAPAVLAQDPAQDVERLAWAPDGTHGAAIIAGRLVAIQKGKPTRALTDGIVGSTFSPDGKIVYALRIVLGNGTDRAEVLQITYASGGIKKLTEWTYPRPDIGTESAVKEAQFADEGGSQRIYRLEDGSLRIWMLGAPTYGVSTTGRTTKLAKVTLPALWASDGMKRIELTESGQTTTMTLRSPDGGAIAKTTIKGLVSHLRWAPDDSQVAFTVGTSVAAGVLQDLYLWDLSNKAPMRLTNTGAAFGAEWLGGSESWR
jgi:hypothetical protein